MMATMPPCADSGIERRDRHRVVWLERAWGALPSTFAGGRGQLAMNRFLLQLDADTELMCLHLRRQAGGGTPVPNCLAIFADGSTRLYQRRELTLEPDRW
jgi:predicted secreted hydrolase